MCRPVKSQSYAGESGKAVLPLLPPLRDGMIGHLLCRNVGQWRDTKLSDTTDSIRPGITPETRVKTCSSHEPCAQRIARLESTSGIRPRVAHLSHVSHVTPPSRIYHTRETLGQRDRQNPMLQRDYRTRVGLLFVRVTFYEGFTFIDEFHDGHNAR